jgi:hypothetical protein
LAKNSQRKPKRGTWRLPVLALFFFAVAALISASGGTHRVRGVMCDQSCARSKPGGVILASEAFFALRFRSTPLQEVWQEYFYLAARVPDGKKA